MLQKPLRLLIVSGPWAAIFELGLEEHKQIWQLDFILLIIVSETANVRT